MKRPEPMRFAQSNGTFLCYRVRDDALGFAGDGGVKLKRPAQSDSLRKLDQKEYAPHSHVRQAYHHCCGVPGTGHISGEREGVCSSHVGHRRTSITAGSGHGPHIGRE